MRLDSWTVRLIVGSVVTGWMICLIASIFSDFEPPDTLNALFLSLAGAAIALNRNGDDEEKEEPRHRAGARDE